ncbi:MAG: Hsp33 family molecular chaperone HslO [Gammaproteobacteria bacterium]|nr:MAG: Hsp33 family molecular chaperone HslO [Gammaproteobacteria bacterium]
MNDTAFKSDNLQRFIFDNAPIRGEWVSLQDSWQQVTARCEYPPAIKQLLGEMMAAAALLAATVKIEGRLVLQIKSTGPVTLMMVECTSNNTLRAFAQWDGDIADEAGLLELTGEGTLAITIEVEGAKQPYQGVVSLQGDSIVDVLETYFQQSEQLNTRIWLVANDNAVAGLFLQQLPSDNSAADDDDESWSRISQLAATVTETELLELGVGTLLYRLFNEEECRLLTATDLHFSCNCSRERVAKTISLLGEQDAIDLLDERGEIEVACEFCNEHYRFDNVDVAEVFSDEIVSPPPSDTLH